MDHEGATYKTLRDEIAMAALLVILQGQLQLAHRLMVSLTADEYQKVAERSYRMADAMLKARGED